MSATYNWAYQPGIINKHNLTFTIDPNTNAPIYSVPDIGIFRVLYVAAFGNDSTGNGSMQYPYKTLAKALEVDIENVYYANTRCIVLASGTYRESPVRRDRSLYLIGDGNVVIDGTLQTPINQYQTSLFNCYIHGTYNLILTGADQLISGGGSQAFGSYDTKFIGVSPSSSFQHSYHPLIQCLITDTSFRVAILRNRQWENSTFIRCDISFMDWFGADPNSASKQGVNACIFEECHFDFTVGPYAGYKPEFFNYSLLHNCRFKFKGDQDYLTYTAIDELRAKMVLQFGEGNYLSNCIIADPLFTNAAIGDYTLSPNSPARNAAYTGDFIGAFSIAYPLQLRTDQIQSGFDISSSVNLQIATDSMTLIDPNQDGQIDSVVIPNLTQQEMIKISHLGVNADRNGKFITASADLSSVPIAAGNLLQETTPYLVRNAAITYNNHSYQPGERFTTVPNVNVFSSEGGGTVHEITAAPQRYTVLMRSGNGGAVIASGSNLTEGDWYYVQSGTVTYETVNYPTGAIFKARHSGTLTGMGTVSTALSNEPYHLYELNAKPTSNNIDDVQIGTVIRGNGDPDYIRGGLGVKEFPINSRFIQLRYQIKVRNLSAS